MSVNVPTRRKAPSAVPGYAVAAAVNAVLLYLINGRPGWQAVPFLTGDTDRVLALVNVSLVAGLAANAAYLTHPAPWLIAGGGVLTTGVGLAVLISLWRVFPFDFGAASGWPVVVRVLLILGIVGSVIGLLVQIVSLLKAIHGRERG